MDEHTVLVPGNQLFLGTVFVYVKKPMTHSNQSRGYF